MTAEIAVLNKYAAAIAADSKVTISAGDQDKKIFDSADKIFEISNDQPIGIMVWNVLSFLGEPLANLIREFREEVARPVDRVDDLAQEFLKFLSDTGKSLKVDVSDQYFGQMASSIVYEISKIRERLFVNEFQKQFSGKNPTDAEIEAFSDDLIARISEKLENVAKNGDQATFFQGTPRFNQSKKSVIESSARREFSSASDCTISKAVDAVKAYMKSAQFISRTGLVFVGFGEKDRFPTLVSYEIDGMVSNCLKINKTDTVDIDRSGKEAAIRPFAQKDMVDRFMHGLDIETQKKIINFSDEAIKSISEAIISKINFASPADKAKIESIAKVAEGKFSYQFRVKALQKMKTDSIADIEGMVEFMPKPDLARTAEALIDLTSIKRKVSTGMETVGGPVDVAVISKSEGFVWVKRKHYFPEGLNQRYKNRTGQT